MQDKVIVQTQSHCPWIGRRQNPTVVVNSRKEEFCINVVVKDNPPFCVHYDFAGVPSSILVRDRAVPYLFLDMVVARIVMGVPSCRFLVACDAAATTQVLLLTTTNHLSYHPNNIYWKTVEEDTPQWSVAVVLVDFVSTGLSQNFFPPHMGGATPMRNRGNIVVGDRWSRSLWQSSPISHHPSQWHSSPSGERIWSCTL